MGKTTPLLEMAGLSLNAGFIPARTTCGDAMLENIIDMLQRAGSRHVNEKKKPIKGFSAGALGFSFGLTFTEEARALYGFRMKLEMICDRLADAGKGMIVLVDEVKPGSPAMQQLATAYQELAGDGKNIAIVMADLPAIVSEVLDEDTLTFLNRATKAELSPIPIGAVRAYFSSAFNRAGRHIGGDVLNSAAQATEGFPYLLQLIGYYLVEGTAEGQRNTQEDLAQAKALAYSDLNENVFRAMLRPLSNADIAFLKAMSQDVGATRTGDLESRLGVSQGHVQSYRKRLIEAGVIVAPRRGEIEFVIPRLTEYLRDEF